MSVLRRTVVLLLTLTLGLSGCHPSGTPTTAQMVPFTVPRGASAHEIARELYEAQRIWHPVTFLFWVKLLGPRKAIQPGLYALPVGANALAIYRLLCAGPPLIKVTFPEGWTAQQMAALLERRAITPAAPFVALVQRNHLEGFLFPDTYLFEGGLPPDQIVLRMTKRFHEKEPKDIHERAKALQLSYPQVVILASIVEREARVAQERPIIAGVFLNRLRKHWRLESCATVEYSLGRWKPRLTYKDLEIKSPYNTYRHAGLPPAPIGNPGAAALEAAAHPAPTAMMFFVADGQGTHRFSQYYSQHLAAQGVRIKK